VSPCGCDPEALRGSVDRRAPDPAVSPSEPREGTIEARVWRDLHVREGQTLEEVASTISANLTRSQVRTALRKLRVHGFAECRKVVDRHGDAHYYWHRRCTDGA
jgi:hypothetical protein